MTLEEIANQRNLPQPREELSTEKLLTLITKLNEENASLTKRIERAEHAEREIANAEHCKNEMWKSYQRMLSEVVEVKRKNDDLLADAVTMRGKLREALEKKEVIYKDKIVYQDRIVEKEKIVYRDKIVYQDRIVEKDKLIYKDRIVPAPKCEMCSKSAYRKMLAELKEQREEYQQAEFLAECCKIFIFFVFILAVFGTICTILMFVVYFIIITVQMYLENNK